MNSSYLGRWNPNQVSGYEKHLNLHSLLSQLAIPSSGCTRRDPLRRKGWMLWPGCGWWQRSVGDCPFPGGLGDTKFWDLRRVVLEAEHSGALYRSHLLRRLLAGDAPGRVTVLRQGAPHLRPSGAEGTGSIQLEDTWAGVLGEHIPLLGEFGGGGREREGRNLSTGEVCHWITKNRAGGDLTRRT